MKKPILRKKILIFAVLLAYSHALFSSDGRTVILTGPDGTQIEGVITPNGNFCVGNACVPVDFCKGACDGYLVNSYEPSEGEGLFPAVGSDTGSADTGGFGTGTTITPPGGGGPIDNSWESTFGQNTTDIFANRQIALDQSLKNMEAEWNSIGKDIGARIMGNDPNPFSVDISEITAANDAQIQQTQQAIVAYIMAYNAWYDATTKNMEATRDKIEEMNKEAQARLDENLTNKVPVKIEERTKLWKDLEAARTQTKAKAGGVITALESGTLVTQGAGGFASSPASVGGDKVRRLDKYLSSVQRSLEGEGPLSPQRKTILDDAKLSNMQADSAYAKGDIEAGDALVRIGYALGDAAIALSPIVVAALAPGAAVAITITGAVAIGKSWYEARTGTRIWDGSPLSVMDRQLAYADVALSMLPGASEILSFSGKAVAGMVDNLSGVIKLGMGEESALALINGTKKLAERLNFATADLAQDFIRWLKRPVHPNLEAGAIGEGGDRALEVIRGLRPEVATLDASASFKNLSPPLRRGAWDIMENLPRALKGDAQATQFINQLRPHELTANYKGWTSLDLVPNNPSASPLRFLYKVKADGIIEWMIRDTH
ncbi:MAG TPA: hypothetical protein VFO10_18290 [Oligoflexus sp.]|uniref:hypothetical protein n=1 Tax=Oligoflexus sp. TaxID=1971216 RepID=UPI002D7ECD0F|nr:hypothetical protein [Oligoflexus sp.]HET9239216.1 hypothetical protein [Oligoflexus sp.]